MSYSSTKENYLNDYKKRIQTEEFSKIEFFREDIEFWFDIYTKFKSEQTVFYDKENPRIIYKILDFKDVKSSEKINHYTKHHGKNFYLNLHFKGLKNKFKRLHLPLRFLTTKEKSIVSILKKHDPSFPKDEKNKKKYFNQKRKSLRSQTGQSNFIEKGFNIYMKYKTFLDKHIKNFNIPKEIIALGFLESSFNDEAISRSNAAGIWQFIPLIGSTMMPTRTKNYDLRVNPFISSLAAFRLILENYNMLQSWNLAIIAYNSGIKHIKKAQKKYGSKISIDQLFSLNNKNIGYASKSYLAEFYALTRILAYSDEIYPHIKSEKDNVFSDIKIYLSKCSLNLKKFNSSLMNLNKQFKGKKKNFPRGTFVTSHEKLSPKKYYKMLDKNIPKIRAKKWIRYLKNKKCGKN